jgi:ABC-type transport system involved in cytochrome bd biosynthesis fused ATPase/permease subunit
VAVDVGLRLDGSHLALRTALIVLLLTPELFAPLRAVGAQYHAGEEGRVAAAAVLDIGAETATSAPLAGSTAAPRRGGISLRDVVVSYPQRDGPVLDIPRLDLSDGEVVAVVGPSGGGKSTLVALLLRFVDATEGGCSPEPSLAPGPSRPPPPRCAMSRRPPPSTLFQSWSRTARMARRWPRSGAPTTSFR